MTERAAPSEVPTPEAPPGGGGDGSVTVVGTAHVSAESVEEVEETIEDEEPDVVAVELDEGRFRQLRGDAPADLEPEDLLRGNTVFQFLAYWILSYVQTRLGDRFDVEPGADMKAAIDAAERRGLGLALVDRDIQVTIQRFWSRMTFVEKLKLVGGLLFGVADARAVGVVLGILVGAVLGPVLGLVSGPLFGVADGFLLGLVGGALVALVASYLAYELARGVLDPIDALAVGVAGGIGVGLVAGPLTGLTDPVLSGVLSGLFLRVVGGIVLGIAAGLVVGSSFGLLLGLAGVRGPEDEEYEEFDVDRMTDTDVVTAMMEEFRRFSPGGASALIDERDAYIAHHLVALREAGHSVVAVVGAGHREGIEGYLADPDDLPPFETLVGAESGSRFSVGRLLMYLFSVGFLAFFGLLFMAGVNDAFLLKLFLAWFLFNGIFAFTLAKLAGARWRSAAVGGAVAWLTSLNPLLAPGWFAGYVELRHTPVNISDVGRLNDILNDEDSPVRDLLSRMSSVPLFRLILIVAAANVGSLIASLLFPVVVLPWLAPEIGGIDGLVAELVRGAENSADLVWSLL